MREAIVSTSIRRAGTKFFTESVFREGGKLHKPAALLSEERNFRAQRPDSAYDIFLVHQMKDHGFVANFKKFLSDRGFAIYIDWMQSSDIGRSESMTATKSAMSNSRTLLYLHGHASLPSRWTAWEIGYFDALKNSRAIGVLPFLNHSGLLPHYGGMEFLKDYTQIGAEYLETFVRNGRI